MESCLPRRGAEARDRTLYFGNVGDRLCSGLPSLAFPRILAAHICCETAAASVCVFVMADGILKLCHDRLDEKYVHDMEVLHSRFEAQPGSDVRICKRCQALH